jgi:hypothetical protein
VAALVTTAINKQVKMKTNQLFMAYHFVVLLIFASMIVTVAWERSYGTFLATFILMFVDNLSIALIMSLSVFELQPKTAK